MLWEKTFTGIYKNVMARSNDGCKYGTWDKIGNANCRFKKAIVQDCKCFQCCPQCEAYRPSCRYFKPSRCDVEVKYLIARFYEHRGLMLFKKLASNTPS